MAMAMVMVMAMAMAMADDIDIGRQNHVISESIYSLHSSRRKSSCFQHKKGTTSHLVAKAKALDLDHCAEKSDRYKALYSSDLDLDCS